MDLPTQDVDVDSGKLILVGRKEEENMLGSYGYSAKAIGLSFACALSLHGNQRVGRVQDNVLVMPKQITRFENTYSYKVLIRELEPYKASSVAYREFNKIGPLRF